VIKVNVFAQRVLLEAIPPVAVDRTPNLPIGGGHFTFTTEPLPLPKNTQLTKQLTTHQKNIRHHSVHTVLSVQEEK